MSRYLNQPTPVIFPNPEASAGVPIRELVERFLNTKTSWETQRAYRREVTGFLAQQHLDAGQTYNDLITIDLAELYNRVDLYLHDCLRFDPHTNRICNARTYNRRRHALSSFFGFLVKLYGFRVNPLTYIGVLKVSNRSNTDDLSESEVLAILNYLKKRAQESETSARDFLLILGMTMTALRRREIAELRWDHIDFTNKSASFAQKGNKDKLIPVPEGYLTLLDKFRKKYGQPCAFIFHPVQNNRFGTLAKPLSVSYIYKLVKQTATTIVPNRNISPHSFRSTFITLGLRWNADINTIQNGTNHHSAAMVLYYDRRNPLENNFIHVLAGFLTKEEIL